MLCLLPQSFTVPLLFACCNGRIPLPPPLQTRLRLRLADGELDVGRRVLTQLRAALGEELRRAKADVNSPDGNNAIARANYVEAMEMLLVQIMLPCGEFAEASSLVSNDPFLGHEEKSHLLKECELSTSRARVTESDSGGRPAGNEHSYRDPRRAAHGQRHRHSALDNQEPPQETARPGQQGPVQKFFSDVSDWTPETRVQLVVGAGAAGLAAYAACRNRDSLWRAMRSAADLATRTAADIGTFIVGSS